MSLIVLGASASSKENRLSGVVFGFDQETNLILLRSKGAHNGVATWRFIPLTSIQSILSSEPTNEASTLPDIDFEVAAKREERATQWVGQSPMQPKHPSILPQAISSLPPPPSSLPHCPNHFPSLSVVTPRLFCRQLLMRVGSVKRSQGKVRPSSMPSVKQCPPNGR